MNKWNSHFDSVNPTLYGDIKHIKRATAELSLDSYLTSMCGCLCNDPGSMFSLDKS